MELHSINAEQGLYVLRSGNGYSCYGFEVAERKRRAVLEWMGEIVVPWEPGTAEHFAAFNDAMTRGAEHARRTGKRCPADLDSRLVGLEGRRVEAIHPDGTRERFYVGKSTGWMPCHLAIERRNDDGGPAVYLPPGAIVRPVGGRL